MKQTNLVIAKRYARAFLISKPEKIDIKKARSKYDQLLELATEIKQYEYYFKNPTINIAIKKELLLKFLPQHKKTEGFTFLEFLLTSKRFNILNSILFEAKNILGELEKTQTAFVISACDMDKENISKLKKSLEKKTGAEIDIKFSVNPQLIGGLQVKIGDTFMDSSILGKLNKAKEKLSA